MGVGALFISPIADVIGRRAVVILSTVIMSVGMFASAATTGVLELWLCRFVTGLGIGGVLASGNTLLAEYAPNRWRDFVISTMVIGYPVGAIIGGSIFAVLVSLYGWRSAFVFGGLASTVLVPLIVLYLPESLDFILSRRRANTLGQVNAVLRRLGRPPLTTLPDMPREETDTKAVIGVFEPRFIKSTLLMVYLVLHAHVQFLFRAVLDAEKPCRSRLHRRTGHFRLGAAQPRRILGGLAFGYFASWSSARTLAPYMLAALFFAIVAFGMLRSGLIPMMAAAFIVGFFLMGSMAGLYIIVPSCLSAAKCATPGQVLRSVSAGSVRWSVPILRVS